VGIIEARLMKSVQRWHSTLDNTNSELYKGGIKTTLALSMKNREKEHISPAHP
jgi:hypothetical protein